MSEPKTGSEATKPGDCSQNTKRYDKLHLPTPPSNTSEELIPYREGDEYDSDLYDMVEVEVSGSDENSSDHYSKISEDISSRDRHNFPGNSSAPDEQSETSSGVSSWSGQARSEAKDVTKSLNELHLDDSVNSRRNPSDLKSSTLGLRSSNPPLSCASTPPSRSPSAQRRVRDDDSWISSKSSRR